MTTFPVGLTLTVAISASAPAEVTTGPAGLQVVRDAEAADCPAASDLALAVNRGLGREAVTVTDASQASLRFSVDFHRQTGGYAAVVGAAGARRGQRVLSDTGPSCAALGDAVGVLLVVLLDGGGELDAAPPPARKATSFLVGAGAGLAHGAIGGWSATVTGTATLMFGERWAARVGGAFLPARSTTFGPGQVEVGLAYGRAALCFSPVGHRPRWELDVCAEPQFGVLTGSGAMYELSNGSTRRPWVAVGGGATLTGAITGRLGWDVEVTAARPLTTERFLVTAVGTAYTTPTVAISSTVSLHVVAW